MIFEKARSIATALVTALVPHCDPLKTRVNPIIVHEGAGIQ